MEYKLNCGPPSLRRAITAAGIALFVGMGGGGPAGGSELPTTADDLLVAVKNALLNHDMTSFTALVNWDQARPIRQRAVKAQISTAFGRPIRSMSLEPFPPDGLKEVESRGTLKANMPISHQLRVVFDEPDNHYGNAPTDLFLIGQDSKNYRIALIIPVQKRAD